jgi:hypothetical protein
MMRKLRRATQSGLPFGESEFIEDLQRRLGRKLLPPRRGRPTKCAAAASPLE